jgi:hypothetical protein
MTYFNYLNKDIFSEVIKFLDMYDIVNLHIALKMKMDTDALYTVKYNIENYSMDKCIRCHKVSLQMRRCFIKNYHKLCNDCVTKCNDCSNYVQKQRTCGSQMNDCNYNCKDHFYRDGPTGNPVRTYCPGLGCSECNKLMCFECLFTVRYTNLLTKSAANHGYYVRSCNDCIKKCKCGKQIKEYSTFETCGKCKQNYCLICKSNIYSNKSRTEICCLVCIDCCNENITSIRENNKVLLCGKCQ